MEHPECICWQPTCTICETVAPTWDYFHDVMVGAYTILAEVVSLGDLLEPCQCVLCLYANPHIYGPIFCAICGEPTNQHDPYCSAHCAYEGEADWDPEEELVRCSACGEPIDDADACRCTGFRPLQNYLASLY